LKKYAAIVSAGLIWLTAMNPVTKDAEISWQANNYLLEKDPVSCI